MATMAPVKKEIRSLAVDRIPVFGGARRDRTVDLNTASVALSQLSYGPDIGDAEYYRRSDPLSSLHTIFLCERRPHPSERGSDPPAVASNPVRRHVIGDKIPHLGVSNDDAHLFVFIN